MVERDGGNDVVRFDYRLRVALRVVQKERVNIISYCVSKKRLGPGTPAKISVSRGKPVKGDPVHSLRIQLFDVVVPEGSK